MKEYVCVDGLQFDCEPHNADWRYIKAESRNQAKYHYSILADAKYINVKCWLKSKFKKIQVI